MLYRFPRHNGAISNEKTIGIEMLTEQRSSFQTTSLKLEITWLVWFVTNKRSLKYFSLGLFKQQGHYKRITHGYGYGSETIDWSTRNPENVIDVT